MRFPYLPFSVGAGQLQVYQPFLKIRIRGRRRLVELIALADTGSVETMLPESVVEFVEGTFSGELVDLEGIGGYKVPARVAEVGIEFGTRWQYQYRSRVAAYAEAAKQPGILGHRDFFLRHRATFCTKERWFEVTVA